MQINLGAFTVYMKYLFKRSNRKTYYYRRRVPEDLLRHYDKSYIEVSLKQTDKLLASKVCEKFHLGVFAWGFQNRRSSQTLTLPLII